MSDGYALWVGVAELFADMDSAAAAGGWHRIPGEASAWVDTKAGRVIQWVANAGGAASARAALKMRGPISGHAATYPGLRVNRDAGLAGAVFLVPPADRERGKPCDALNGERLRTLLAWCVAEGVPVERLAPMDWQ